MPYLHVYIKYTEYCKIASLWYIDNTRKFIFYSSTKCENRTTILANFCQIPSTARMWSCDSAVSEFLLTRGQIKNENI